VNVEITGACGGIGSVLVDRPIHSGHNMVLIDNLLGGSEENIEKNEILSTLKLIYIHDFEKVSASLID
jgi:UDP-glucose 4-epimerase